MSQRQVSPARCGCLLVALAVLSPATARSQVPVGPGGAGRAGTLTRAASRYQDLEGSLMQALRDKDDGRLDQLLADDFEELSAERFAAGSRDDWRRAGAAAAVRPFRIHNLTVHEFDQTAVVSYLLARTAGSPASTPTVFIVDIWNSSTGKLQVRYLSTPRRPAQDRMHKH
jgi:hypothetical protein